MEFTFSIQTIAIFAAIIFPFFSAGMAEFIKKILLRIVSFNTIDQIIKQDASIRKMLAESTPRKHVSVILVVPIGEEVVFRLIPFLFLIHLDANTFTIVVTGATVSILFGLIHYWNSRSAIFSLAIQGLIGFGLFMLFYLQYKAFGILPAFLIICGVHLFYNGMYFIHEKTKPILYNQKDFYIEYFYSVLSNRDFDKERQERMDKFFKEQEKFYRQNLDN